MNQIKNLLTIALLLVGAVVFGQTKLSGKVVDENNVALPGANVVIKNTTKGTLTDFDGNFNLECKETSGTVIVSFVGYEAKNVDFSGSKNFGAIQLAPSANTLDEVVIVGVADIAKDRQTPVAVSTIKATEIVEKLGTQEFPEILKSTPSVYATKSGGAFGDSRITIRGFAQENIAILINGVPVNDMENSKVYWSNWAGLSDVTSAMQVQRGLGSSKLAISSVGGTINVLTRTSDMKEGGSVSFMTGNDYYYKGLVSYSTGLLESGLSASVLYSHTQGDGYVDATEFSGDNYFIGLGYQINDNNSIMFTATGAPQWHNQRYYTMPISTYLNYSDNDDPNIKYNNLWGTYKGEVLNFRRNFYHKPIASLNWDLKINENSSVSTAIYGSWGRGGGSGDIGKINGKSYYDSRFYNSDGLLRFDDIAAWNSGSSITGWGADKPVGATVNGEELYYNSSSSGFSRRSSMNSHNWYGLLSNFNTKFTDKLKFDFGVDLRTYRGIHYQVVSDLLGANGFSDNTDVNNPNRVLTTTYEPSPSWNPFENIKDQEKIGYWNDGKVKWMGAFTQLEYTNDVISAFVQGGVSNQSFQRIDYFLYTPENQESDVVNILGGNVKGGLNFNINEKHNVFANAGYYSKQPAFGSIFPFYTNKVNEVYQNEIVLGLELGYGFRSKIANVNLNLYRTGWNDRFLRRTFSGLTYNFTGINEVHYGVETEINLKPVDNLKLMGMFSWGDWYYEGNATGTAYDENTNSIVATNELKLDGVKVGNAAQFTANLGLEWNVFKNLKFDISQFYADKLYGAIDPSKFTDGSEALKLPSYSLTDLGLGYKFDITNNYNLDLRFGVNNLWDHIYISESDTNYAANPGDATWNGIKTNNSVYFGWGRTWNASVRFNF